MQVSVNLTLEHFEKFMMTAGKPENWRNLLEISYLCHLTCYRPK